MALPDPDVPFVLLDDSRQAGAGGRSMLFHSPEDIICARSLDEVPAALAKIDAAVGARFHVAGWMAYECAAVFEPRLQSAQMPKPDEPYVWMLVTEHRELLTEADVDRWLDMCSASASVGCIKLQKPSIAKPEYVRAARAIKNYIEAGDIYQANYTFPYDCSLEGSAPHAYRKLRARQPVDYGAFIETGEHTILSLSPELFVKREGARVQTRPMKGTSARRDALTEDAAATVALAADEKSRAENLMIVDLIRNDLSRIAVKGSVTVTDMFTVETYPTVHQMTSGVEASIDQDIVPSQLLEALFPCGSVTGAPKIRAMEIIAELETGPRGVYCGAIGHFSPAVGDEAVNWALNVPIRTIVLNAERQGRLAVGSGIVADSDIDEEYRECILKAAFASRPSHNLDPNFHLIETMRVQGGTVCLLSRHMSRLMAGVRYFDIPVTEKDVRAEVDRALNSLDSDMPSGLGFEEDTAPKHKMRLTVRAGGEVAAVVSEMNQPAGGPLYVRIAEEAIDSADPLRRHKTSMRSLYDRATSRAADLGLADILFLNEKGEVAEGAISNIFIETANGWFTPSIDSGALPGVMRAEMLDSATLRIREKSLSIEDLINANAIYIGNALRGLRQVTLQTPDQIKG